MKKIYFASLLIISLSSLLHAGDTAKPQRYNPYMQAFIQDDNRDTQGYDSDDDMFSPCCRISFPSVPSVEDLMKTIFAIQAITTACDITQHKALTEKKNN